MLSRLLTKSSHFRLLNNLCPKSHSYNQNPSAPLLLSFSRFLSTNQNNNNGNNDNNDNNQSSSNVWNLGREVDGNLDQLFGDTDTSSVGGGSLDQWLNAASAEENKPWSLVDDVKEELFDHGESLLTVDKPGSEDSEEEKELTEEDLRKLEIEEKELKVVIKGNDFLFKFVY